MVRCRHGKNMEHCKNGSIITWSLLSLWVLYIIYTLNQQGEQAGSSGIIAKELHPRLPTSQYFFSSISSPAPHHSILICRKKVNKGKKKKKKAPKVEAMIFSFGFKKETSAFVLFRFLFSPSPSLSHFLIYTLYQDTYLSWLYNTRHLPLPLSPPPFEITL